MSTQTKTKTSTAVKIALITLAVGGVLAAGVIASKNIKKSSNSAATNSDTRCVAKPAGNTCSDLSGQTWCTTDCKGGTYAGTYCCVGTCCVPIAHKDDKKCSNGTYVPKNGCCSNTECGLGKCKNGSCVCDTEPFTHDCADGTKCNECCNDSNCKSGSKCALGACMPLPPCSLKCNGKCIEPDASNCGACGKKCSLFQKCNVNAGDASKSSCESCGGGKIRCGNKCITVFSKTDLVNLASCFIPGVGPAKCVLSMLASKGFSCAEGTWNKSGAIILTAAGQKCSMDIECASGKCSGGKCK